MFVTIDLLKKHNACEGGIKFFERFYPNGAEAAVAMRTRHVNKEFLHWAREEFEPNEEELKAYCEVCNIVNSKEFWRSEDIENSERIVESKKVKNSKRIFNSNGIDTSFDIVESEEILGCQQIFYSSMVDNG